ncbi:MAG: thioredoxin-related protein [Saprospiraceae bacterium]|jgi:thioredoxin-related protein
MKMKKLLMVIIIITLSQQLSAQEWTYDFEKAKQIAKKEGKEILLVFAGSDWCAPCIKLERNILETTEFQNHSEENYVLVKADFPRKKANKLSREQLEHNERLAEIYNREGHFPLVLLITKNGLTIGKTGFKNISPNEYIKLLESFKS